jgi:hypothetical protein
MNPSLHEDVNNLPFRIESSLVQENFLKLDYQTIYACPLESIYLEPNINKENKMNNNDPPIHS